MSASGETPRPASGATPADPPSSGSSSEALAATPEGSEHNRIISGIDLIDYAVGGLSPEKVYVVKGGIGTGKSILGLQFLSRGLELHEPGVLITDQKPENVLEQARNIGFSLDEAVKRGQLLIMNPSKRYFELVESPADVMAIMEELSEYIQKVGAKRLVVDPVYTLVNTSYSSHFALSVTQSLMNALEDLPVTTLLIAGDEENPELNPIVRMLEQNSSGIIALSPDTATGGRIMRLNKLRFGSTDHQAAHYRILNGKGLMNYRGEGERVADVTKPWEETGMNKTVMILGATPDTISKVKEALGTDYSISAEADLKKGVERVLSENPGLVIVSPSRSVQAISSVLELAKNSTSSIVFLSPSNNRASDKILYLRVGADDFITEPFSPAELRARVDALVRRSGRRLNVRDSSISQIDSEELTRALDYKETSRPKSKEIMQVADNKPKFDPEFNNRLTRNIDTVSKLDMNFAVYWMKSPDKQGELNRELAKLCRQEDILCHNANGEFVAILTGSDENGVKGFESRIDEKLGDSVNKSEVKRGFFIHGPGSSGSQARTNP